MTAAANVTYIRSQQQEDIDDLAGTYRRLMADQSTVDAFVAGSSDEVLECRTRGHRWPFRRTRDGFTGFDDGTGLLINREKCRCCGLVYRVEYWEAIRVSRGHHRYVRVDVKPEYDDGYLAPAGQGYMTRRQIDEALMTASIGTKPLAAIKKAAQGK